MWKKRKKKGLVKKLVTKAPTEAILKRHHGPQSPGEKKRHEKTLDNSHG